MMQENNYLEELNKEHQEQIKILNDFNERI